MKTQRLQRCTRSGPCCAWWECRGQLYDKISKTLAREGYKSIVPQEWGKKRMGWKTEHNMDFHSKEVHTHQVGLGSVGLEKEIFASRNLWPHWKKYISRNFSRKQTVHKHMSWSLELPSSGLSFFHKGKAGRMHNTIYVRRVFEEALKMKIWKLLEQFVLSCSPLLIKMKFGIWKCSKFVYGIIDERPLTKPSLLSQTPPAVSDYKPLK